MDIRYNILKVDVVQSRYSKRVYVFFEHVVNKLETRSVKLSDLMYKGTRLGDVDKSFDIDGSCLYKDRLKRFIDIDVDRSNTYEIGKKVYNKILDTVNKINGQGDAEVIRMYIGIFVNPPK